MFEPIQLQFYCTGTVYSKRALKAHSTDTLLLCWISGSLPPLQCNVLLGQWPCWNYNTVGAYLITGLDSGLDCWTGLMDWIIGLNLLISHDLHPIKCCKFGYSKRTSSSHCLLGNVHECTMHKLHGRMCIMNSWCACSDHQRTLWL